MFAEGGVPEGQKPYEAAQAIAAALLGPPTTDTGRVFGAARAATTSALAATLSASGTAASGAAEALGASAAERPLRVLFVNRSARVWQRGGAPRRVALMPPNLANLDELLQLCHEVSNPPRRATRGPDG